VVLDAAGKTLLSRRFANHEQEIVAVLADAGA